MNFTVPILGWSSTVQMSNDTDTRVVAAKYYVGTTNSPGANLPINFDSKLTDTHNAVTTGSSWRFTAPVPGTYCVAVHTQQDTATAYGVRVYKNATLTEILYYSASGGATYSGSTLIDLVAGDYIDIRPDAAGGIRGSATPAYLSAVSINRLSGPSAIAASETVAARYTNTAGTTITNSLTSVPFATRAYDSHGSFSTPTYTVPVAGKYRVSAVLSTQSVTLATTNEFQVQIFKTGTMAANAFTLGNGAANGQSVQVHTTIDCLAGDTLDVRARISSSVALSTTANNNFICIERIGN